tara:strand:- start:1187 stop:2389 length:1203 start_codon:yes stop_codon:yes gene_type:complete
MKSFKRFVNQNYSIIEESTPSPAPMFLYESKSNMGEVHSVGFTKNSIAPAQVGVPLNNNTSAQSIFFGVKEWLYSQTKFDISKEQIEYMLYLMGQIQNIKPNGSAQLEPPPFTKQDTAKIAVNFGEVLAGIWACGKYPSGIGLVNFPSKNNFPIGDIIVPMKEGGIELASVKSGGGSPTSFSGIWGMATQEGLTKPYFKKRLKRKEREVIQIIDECIMGGKSSGKPKNTWRSVKNHALYVAQWFYRNWDSGSNFGLDVLAKIVGTRPLNITDEYIENWMRNTMDDDPSNIKDALAPFYSAIGKSPSADAWTRYHDPKHKHKSLKIQSPLSYHMVDWMNDLYAPSFSSLLSTFANVRQIDVELNSKGRLEVNIKPFTSMQFKFASFMTSNRSQNKIGFKKL